MTSTFAPPGTSSTAAAAPLPSTEGTGADYNASGYGGGSDQGSGQWQGRPSLPSVPDNEHTNDMDRNTIRLGIMLPLALSFLTASATAQVGALDPSFDADGVRTDSLSALDVARNVVLDTEGKILVFGKSEGAGDPNSREARIIRYHLDGTLDQTWTFNHSGCGGLNVPEDFFAGTVEPGGQILAAGYVQDGCSGSVNRNFSVVRYQTAGGNATAFDTPTFNGDNDQVRSLALQEDGKVVALGFSQSSSSSTTRDVAFARYNADGTLDNTFGTGGEVLIDIAGDHDFGLDVALQADGKMVAAGFATLSGQLDAVLVRLNTDGTLDTSFDDDGIVTIDVNGFTDQARALALQADGKIVTAGGTTSSDGATTEFTVMRFDTAGSLDTSFGTGGITTVDFAVLPAATTDIVVQADGKIVVTGYTETGAGGELTRDFAVARLNTDGTLDPSFDSDGKNTVDVAGGSQDTPLAIILQPDGNIVVAGVTEYEDGSWDVAVARFIGDSGPLPVELTGLEATVDGRGVQLSWTTASETNNAGFYVERTAGEAAWETLDFVEGEGTTTTAQHYRFTDTAPPFTAQAVRYRLRQVDFDGTVEYIGEVKVELARSEALALHGVYPNPFRAHTTIRYELPVASHVRLAVYDVLGREVVMLVDGSQSAGRYEANLEGATLPSGLYVYRIEAGGFTATRQMLLVK